jgi:hypothetical protein
MHKSKKNRTIKKRNKKCIYTDEAKRVIKFTKILRQNNKKIMKTMKNSKTK